MATYKDKHGYKRNHSNLVHRQRAYHGIYLPNKHDYEHPFSYYEVHHKDGDKTNNKIANLEILTPKEHDEAHEKMKRRNMEERQKMFEAMNEREREKEARENEAKGRDIMRGEGRKIKGRGGWWSGKKKLIYGVSLIILGFLITLSMGIPLPLLPFLLIDAFGGNLGILIGRVVYSIYLIPLCFFLGIILIILWFKDLRR